MSTINYRLLLVDDDTAFHQKMRVAFTQYYVFEGARSRDEALFQLNKHPPFDLILLDLNLNDHEDYRAGLNNIPIIAQQAPHTPIIVISNHRQAATIVDAVQKGAVDYFAKADFGDIEHIRFWQQRITQHITDARNRQQQQQLTQMVLSDARTDKVKTSPIDAFVGSSPEMQSIKKQLSIVAQQDTIINLLILGESGVGKEVAARYFHAQSKRCHCPFVAINLSAIPYDLLESELFGHKKGAFTNALSDKVGLLEQAQGGIVLLDEIGEISPNLQVKILRFLQDHCIRPVGGDRDLRLDVQVIAATNADLQKAVDTGSFRLDLLQRLKDYTITLPPLRKRKEDIAELCQFFTQKTLPQLANQAVIDRFMHYHWPGNVRELASTLRQTELKMVILAQAVATLDCLPAEMNQISPYSHHSTPLPPHHTELLNTLNHIEQALQNHTPKAQIAQQLNKTADDLLYFIKKKHFIQQPQLFAQYPNICKAYKLTFPPS